MICAEFVSDAASAVSLRPTAVQPADLSTCAAVVLTGTDSGALTTFAIPLPADAATAWALGFSLVVGSYIMGWACGAVVNFINSR